MDLRDHLAARFAAALVDAFPDPAAIARRAYDLAEAMLAERARRVDVEEGEGAIVFEPAAEPFEAPPPPDYHGMLLDEPMPPFDDEEPYAIDDEDIDPRLLEPPYDPSWDVEPRWTGEPRRPSRPPVSDRPGLARTQPEEGDAKERSA